MSSEQKLTEAMAEFVKEQMAQPSAPTGNAKPRTSDVIIFVVFAANLALLMWSLPSEFLKSEQWEFYEKIIPAVGGSLFTLIAAWFKEETVNLIQRPWFRWGQIPLAVVSLLLGAPVLPLQLKVEPADQGAILFMDKDDQDHFREWRKTVWVSLAEHDLIAKHADPKGWNPRTFHLSRRDLLAILWRQREVELPLLYSVRVNLSDPGLTVSIRKSGTEFDDDFLRAENLAPQHLSKLDKRTLMLIPASNENLGPLTKLPAGEYELTVAKTGCGMGSKVALILPPAMNPENCEVELETPPCMH
jgi:hypothetical protein